MSLLLLASLASYQFNFECRPIRHDQDITVILSQNPLSTHPMAGPQLEGVMEIFSGDFQDKVNVITYARDWTWITSDSDKYSLIQRQHDSRMFRKKEGAPVTLKIWKQAMPFPGPLEYELFCNPIKA